MAPLARFYKTELPKLWKISEHAASYEAGRWSEAAALQREPAAACVAETLARLEEAFGGELAELMRDQVCFPTATNLRPKDGGSAEEWALYRAASLTLLAWALRHPSDELLRRLADRMRYMFGHVDEGAEISSASGPDAYWEPGMGFCLAIVIAHASHPLAAQIIEDVLRGRWDVPASAYEAYQSALHSKLSEMFEARFAVGAFDFALFAAAADRIPNAVSGYRIDPHRYDDIDDEPEGEPSPFEVAITGYTQRYVFERSAEFSPATQKLLGDIHTYRPTGLRWLLRACRHVEALQLTVLDAEQYEDAPRALRFLANIRGLEAGERGDDVVRELKAFPPQTLEVLLPFAGAAQDLVLQALDRAAAAPLLAVIHEISSLGFPGPYDNTETDIPNNSDPDCGVVDRSRILAALDQAGDARARQLIGLLRKSRMPIRNSLTLIEAVKGWNQAAILKQIPKHGQVSLKAFGLLPLAQGEDEVLERYLALQNAAKEASQYGAERQANTRAAAAAGIANLAANAGYSDAVRLEWAMEARAGGEAALATKARTIGAWQVSVKGEDSDPTIVVEKGGKELAAVPAGLKKEKAFLEVKNAVAQWKTQTQRFRRTFEDMMVGQQPLAGDDLRRLLELPAARALITRLLLRGADGEYGYLDAERGDLSGLAGRAPLTDASLPHSFQLFSEGRLSDWQRETVRRRIVQPFKQIFRELYVLTPAERESGTFSMRFAGHAVKPRVASKLLQSRGWEMLPGDEAVPCRRFRKLKLMALFDMEGVGHYLGEDDDEPPTTGRIHFLRPPASGEWTLAEDVPLSSVSEIVFSEVMRDADLVVSVAGVSDEAAWTEESLKGRIELLLPLIDELGLANVRCEGHFAFVAGKRAHYRVHLGSGAVHIEPGQYLCIVPERELERGPGIYLPFADADDKLTAQVISKLVLLANDERITDKTILQQIQAAQRA